MDQRQGIYFLAGGVYMGAKTGGSDSTAGCSASASGSASKTEEAEEPKYIMCQTHGAAFACMAATIHLATQRKLEPFCDRCIPGYISLSSSLVPQQKMVDI